MADDTKKSQLEKYNELQREYLNIEKDILMSKTLIQQATDDIVDMEQQLVNAAKKRAAEIRKEIALDNEIIATERKELAYSEMILRKGIDRLNEERLLLGVWEQMKVRAGGIVSAWKKFDYVAMGASFKNQMYVWDLIEKTVGQVGIKSAILLEIAKDVAKEFQSWDTTLSKFRQSFGLFREDALSSSKHTYTISRDMMAIARDLAHLGVNIGTVVGSFESISSLVGGIWNVSKELVKTLSAMSVSLGVSQDVSSGALRNMALMAGTTIEAQTNSLLFAQALSNAAGVSFAAVATDIGKMSDTALLFTRKGVPGLIRAAVELRKMGTSFTDAAHAASSLLEFGSSINSEMEASVLLGRSMNLQRARELAYAGDLEGSTKELLRIAKSVHFTGLDYFQKGAVAKAMGLTVDQVYNMLQVDKEREVILRSQDKTVQAMNAEYNRLRNSSEKTRQSEAERVKLSLMNKVNLSRTASIAASWNQIVSKLAYFFLPVIDKSLAAINWLVSKVADNLLISTSIGAALWAGVKKGWISFRAIGDVIKALGEEIFFVAMKKNWVWLETVGAWVNKIGMGISAWTGKLGTIAAKVRGLFELLPFGKFIARLTAGLSGLFGGIAARLGVVLKFVGRLIVPAMFAWHIFQRIRDILNDKSFMSIGSTWKFNGLLLIKAVGVILGALWDTFNDLGMGLPNLIVKGLVAAGKGIWEAVKGWSAAIWLGLKDFIGFSPSVLGMSIVNGLVSVGPMILRALMSPFEALLKWISSVPILGGIMHKMGIDAGPKSVEKGATAAYIPAVTVTPTGTKVAGMEKKAPGEKPSAEEKGATLDDILSADKEIIGLLKSILAKDSNVHMDGQLLSTQLARQTEFRGGYGVNKIA